MQVVPSTGGLKPATGHPWNIDAPRPAGAIRASAGGSGSGSGIWNRVGSTIVRVSREALLLLPNPYKPAGRDWDETFPDVPEPDEEKDDTSGSGSGSTPPPNTDTSGTPPTNTDTTPQQPNTGTTPQSQQPPNSGSQQTNTGSQQTPQGPPNNVLQPQVTPRPPLLALCVLSSMLSVSLCSC